MWSLIALSIRTLTGEIALNGLRDAISMRLNNGCMYGGIYWFFYTVIFIYMWIPFIGMIPEKDRKRSFEYAIFILFLLYSIFPYFFSLVLRLPWPEQYTSAFSVKYGIYILLGYYLSHYELSKEKRMLLYVCGILGFLILWVGTTYFSYQYSTLWGGFCGWNGFPAVLMNASILTAAKQAIKQYSEKSAKICRLLAGSSLGVYLIHNFFVHWFQIWFPIDVRSPIWLIGAPIAIYAISLSIVLAMKRISVIRALVP